MSRAFIQVTNGSRGGHLSCQEFLLFFHMGSTTASKILAAFARLTFVMCSPTGRGWTT